MDRQTIMVELVTPQEIVFRQQCLSATFKAGEGTINLQANQGDFVSLLQPGQIRIHVDENTQEVFEGGEGLVVFKYNHLLIVWRDYSKKAPTN